MATILAGAALVLVVAACNSPSGSDEGSPTSTAAAKKPDRAPFSGAWDTAWGTVTLVQDGEQITGSFSGRFDGSLEGTVSGHVADLAWTQTNGEKGRARFELADPARFEGTWGAGTSATNGGIWNGKRIKGIAVPAK